MNTLVSKDVCPPAIPGSVVDGLLKQFPAPVEIDSQRSKTLYTICCGLVVIPVCLYAAYTGYGDGDLMMAGVGMTGVVFFAYCLLRAFKMHGASLHLDAEGFQAYPFRRYSWSEVSNFETRDVIFNNFIAFKPSKTALRRQFVDMYTVQNKDLVRLMNGWQKLALQKAQ